MPFIGSCGGPDMVWKLRGTGGRVLVKEGYRIAEEYCCGDPDKDPSEPMTGNMSAMTVECSSQGMVFMKSGRLCGTAKRSVSDAISAGICLLTL